MSRLRRIPRLPALIGLVSGAALLVAVIVVFALVDTIAHNCGQIENIKDRIRMVVAEDQQRLGQPGSAGYAYYRAHPDELSQARAGAADTLARFRAGRC